MKLLIVGSDKIFAIENFYVKYLRERGVEIFLFPAQGIFYDYYQKNIFNKLLYKFGLSGIIKKINHQFKNTVNDFKPDTMWVFKGMEILPESLQWAKKKNIKLVNYNPDNPFIFSGKGSGNSNLKNAIGLYDLHLTYNTAVKKQMEAVYKIRTEILPFGYEVSEQLLLKCAAAQEIKKVCFLGNPDKFRGAFLQNLAEQGMEIDVYGNNWSDFVNHTRIQIFEPVYGDDLWITLRKYRVQLNLSRPHTQDTHNMRSFEIPGVGGIQLAPHTPDHATYFEPDTEIILYKDEQDCVLQAKKILQLTDAEANLIRLEARKRSVDAGYAYKDRAQQALLFINSLYE